MHTIPWVGPVRGLVMANIELLASQAVAYAQKHDGKRWSVFAAIDHITPYVEPEDLPAVKRAIEALRRPKRMPRKRAH